jgi:hypothetical protein
MGTRSIRVTVRGSFDGLTAAQRSDLLAAQDEHDFRYAAYTPEGHLSYDIAARPFFTFRFLTAAEQEQDVPAAAARAEAGAVAWLADRGYRYKGLTVSTEDLSQAPVGARQRRAARRGRAA